FYESDNYVYFLRLVKKYIRHGPLFAESFKSIYVDKDNYLIHLCRYIHTNPLKAKLIADLKDWPFSNYLEFLCLREGSLFDREFFDAYFANPEEYDEFVHDYKIAPPDDFPKYVLD
ncbi:MAG: hypothetical protein ACE5HI_08260, partial [bacterium]